MYLPSRHWFSTSLDTLNTNTKIDDDLMFPAIFSFQILSNLVQFIKTSNCKSKKKFVILRRERYMKSITIVIITNGFQFTIEAEGVGVMLQSVILYCLLYSITPKNYEKKIRVLLRRSKKFSK